MCKLIIQGYISRTGACNNGSGWGICSSRGSRFLLVLLGCRGCYPSSTAPTTTTSSTTTASPTTAAYRTTYPNGLLLLLLTILSVLSASSKLFVDTHDARDEAADARKKFRHPSGDHLTVLNVVRAYEDVSRDDTKKGRKEWCRRMFVNERCLAEAANIRAQLRDVCERTGIDWKANAGQGREGCEGPVLRALV